MEIQSRVQKIEEALEHLKYVAWARSAFSFVVDALSGERLDILEQCVKLRVDGSRGGALAAAAAAADAEAAARDPFELVLDEVRLRKIHCY